MNLLKKIIPIEKNEWSRFLPVAVMMTCALFNYTVLRDIKDALINSSVGTEAIPYLKGAVVTTAAIITTIIYMKLSSFWEQRKIFLAFTIFFMGFFVLFAFFLYPNLESIQPNIASINLWKEKLPYIAHAISVLAVWPVSFFYVVSELWGSFFISFFVWQLANEITTSKEAKRFYPSFNFISNLSLILAGGILLIILKYGRSINGQVSYNALKSIVMVMVISAVCMTTLYMHISINILDKQKKMAFENAKIQILKDKFGENFNSYKLNHKMIQEIDQEALIKIQGHKKVKMGVIESVKYLVKQKNLALIAVIVLSYGLAINLLDIAFKKQLNIFSASKSANYLDFAAKISIATGIAVIFLVSCFNKLLDKLGWFKTAAATPLVILTMGSFFLLLIEIIKYFNLSANYMIFDLISIAQGCVILGATQNVLSKGSKYVLFDPTKEMLYISMKDPEMRTKGKAAVDVMGGRMGKASGSFLWMLLLSSGKNTDVSNMTIYILTILCITAGVWLYTLNVIKKSNMVQDESHT